MFTSSAKIPFSLFSYIVTSQSRPTCWYSLSVCFSSNDGIMVLTLVVSKVYPVGCKLKAVAAIVFNTLSSCGCSPVLDKIENII
jgi:hypothetical protein